MCHHIKNPPAPLGSGQYIPVPLFVTPREHNTTLIANKAGDTPLEGLREMRVYAVVKVNFHWGLAKTVIV